MRLDPLIMKTGKIYLEETEHTGVDYSFFNAPILLQNQPNGSLVFLKELFKKRADQSEFERCSHRNTFQHRSEAVTRRIELPGKSRSRG